MTDIEKRRQKISEQVKIFTSEEIAIIKETVAKGTTDTELAFFLNVCKVYGLNPFTKEIWAYKDLKNNLIVFAGRDGFLAKAQRDPRWNGISSDIVREGESITMNIAEGKISHIKDITSKANILGAYAICKPKGCELPTIEWADFETYNKNNNVWKSDPAAMIKKVAEVHALKKAYGISGLQVEEDFRVIDDRVVNIDHEEIPTTKSIGYASELLRRAELTEDYKDIIEKKLIDKEITSAELDNIITELKNYQPKQYSIF